MIKIISGTLKGRKLKNIDVEILRPTQAKVRKSIMDSIRIFKNKDVLDLFSGVGTLGIEALSRGAKSVKFIDNNYKIISKLNQNIEMLNLTEKVDVVKSDVIRFLKKETKKYDLIFADPPYYSYKIKDFLPLISSLLKENGLFCYESNKESIDNIDDKCTKIKYFGNTQIIFWEKIK
jgi:16S rRNA (guanine966-N2)-methyltransferase